MCCRRHQYYANGPVYGTRRCRRGGPIRALVGVIVKAVEQKQQERALLKQLAPQNTEGALAVKERYPTAFRERGIMRESRPQQERTASAPPPEYRDEKDRLYVDERRRGYEFQAPPPQYEDVVEERR